MVSSAQGASLTFRRSKHHFPGHWKGTYIPRLVKDYRPMKYTNLCLPDKVVVFLLLLLLIARRCFEVQVV